MSKNILILVAIALVAVTTFGLTGFAYAQTPTPGTPGTNASGFGPGTMRRGGGGMQQMGGVDGPLHDGMISALASKLGLSAADLQARISAGETAYQIAQSKGLSAVQIQDLLSQARTEALKAAVTAGTLTQAQADWMGQRMSQMGQNGMGMGPRHNSNTNTPGSGPAGRWNNQPVK